MLYPDKPLTVDSDEKIRFTPRHAEVLFFLIRGKTYEKIADILGLSVRTVQDHIDILKYKFLAHNKYELVEFAIKKGYLNFIPKSILHRQISLVLDPRDYLPNQTYRNKASYARISSSF